MSFAFVFVFDDDVRKNFTNSNSFIVCLFIYSFICLCFTIFITPKKRFYSLYLLQFLFGTKNKNERISSALFFSCFAWSTQVNFVRALFALLFCFWFVIYIQKHCYVYDQTLAIRLQDLLQQTHCKINSNIWMSYRKIFMIPDASLSLSLPLFRVLFNIMIGKVGLLAAAMHRHKQTRLHVLRTFRPLTVKIWETPKINAAC